MQRTATAALGMAPARSARGATRSVLTGMKGTSDGYAPAPKRGDRCWARPFGWGDDKATYIEVSSIELVFRSGWAVWGWLPSRSELLPRKYFVPVPEEKTAAS